MSSRGVLSVLASVGVVTCAVATLLGHAGRVFWLFDLASHFCLQYALTCTLCIAVLAILKRWRWAAAGGLVLLVNLVPISGLYWPQEASLDPQREKLELVVFNVKFDNKNHQQVAAYLAKQEADVVVVLEATDGAETALRAALLGYQVLGHARSDAFGMLVFSRIPLLKHQLLYFADSELLSISLALRKGGEHFSLLALHTMPPVGATNTKLRDQMLKASAAWAREHPNAIIAGDFNTTPWSYIFGDLLEEAQLHNSQRGFGIQSSWPGGFWPLSIPIDHCVHSQNLRTHSREVGPFLGSDHRPLRLTVGFAP